MSAIDRVLGRVGSVPVLGTHISPVCLFSDEMVTDSDDAIAVIRVIAINGEEVLVTRCGGLFMVPPEALQGFSELSQLATDVGAAARIQQRGEEKFRFQEAAIERFNRLLCELALSGLVSEPVSAVHIGHGALLDGHALVVGAGGGRESYFRRTMDPTTAIVANREWSMWPLASVSLLDQAGLQARTSVLASISPTLPYLTVAAYSHFSQAQWTAALSDSWVVTEQLIGYLWARHVGTVPIRSGVGQPSKSRLPNVSSQINDLGNAGLLPAFLTSELHDARLHRNELAHRAEISQQAATAGMTAMRLMIEHVTGLPVEAAHPNVSVNW